MKINFLKKIVLVAVFSFGSTAYAASSEIGLDMRNSIAIRENGYGYARKAIYEPSRFFQNFETFGESGNISLEEVEKYRYESKGATGGTFGRVWRNWILGLGYGYVESQGKISGLGRKELDTLGTNLYLTQRSETWAITMSGGYTQGKNRVKLIDNSYDYRSEVWSIGMELNSRYEHRKNYNVYPYVGFDYFWEKDKISDGKKKEVPLGKAGIIIEERHGQWLYALDLAWLQNLGEKNTMLDEKGTGYFKYSVEREIGQSMVLGIYYGGYLVQEDYLNRYGMTLRYNW